ncbi:hypothetical protein ABBQ32_011455 [Trebouxia sp. C0010 RCD-2024]
MTSRLLSTVVLCAIAVCTGAANTSRKLLDDGCASAFGQCGGETCMGGRGSSTCIDAAYACCPTSYTCQRQTSQRWQCMPEAAAAGLTDVMSSIEVVATQPSQSSVISSLPPSQIQGLAMESQSEEQLPRPTRNTQPNRTVKTSLSADPGL